MAIVIGSATTVLVDGTADGFQSVNWNVNRQPTRLWQLGNWDPYNTQVAKTITVSITTYASVLSTVTLAPAQSCANSTATKTVSIDAQTCGGSAVSIGETMYLTSYSYSKGDPVGFGTESWSFQFWEAADVFGAMIPIPDPSSVIQGRAEGSRFGDVGNGSTDLGVRFIDDPGAAPADNYHIVVGTQGSVSAGFPGIGNADDVQLGLIDRIGGGKLQAGGEIGQSNATIPHQPLYYG